MSPTSTSKRKVTTCSNSPNSSSEHRTTSHRVSPLHFAEWVKGSGVDSELVTLNIESLSGDEAIASLLYALPHEARRNDGRLRDTWLRRYKHVMEGGWWCSGVDLQKLTESDWGCFKPDNPRIGKKGKPLKYEHPPKTATGIFALRTPNRIWRRIAKRYKVRMPTDPTMSFWQWVLEHPEIPVIITEGAKKAGALLTAGYCAIALPGIFNGYRTPKDENGDRKGKRYLIPELLKLAFGDRTFLIAFDQDIKPSTIDNVRTAIATLGRLLEDEGCPVRVMTWSNNHKGIDDLWVNEDIEALNRAVETAKSLHAWKGTRPLRQVDITVSERYISVPFPEDSQMICLRAPKGTGKTEAISKYIQSHIKDHRIIVLTHRIQLAQDLARRFGIDHISEVDESEAKGMLGFALCIDSLHLNCRAKFKPSDWEDAIIVIDEVEQVLWHMVNSPTLQLNRTTIIDNLGDLIRSAIQGGYGKLLLADADLSDRSIDYLSSFVPDIKPYIIENTWRAKVERKVTVYEGKNPNALLNDLYKAIERGEKPFISTGSQKTSSTHSTINLEKKLKQKFPQKNIIRIDSETIADKEHPAYCCILNGLNEFLLGYDIVIVSPSIETGVSIDLRGYFTSVWIIANGVQSPNSIRQVMARVRENLPRYIWIRKSAHFSRLGNGKDNPKWLRAGEFKRFNATTASLGMSDLEKPTYQDSALNLWADYAADLNHQFTHYKEQILEDLKEEGYTISYASLPDKERLQEIGAQMKAVKEESYETHCKKIVGTKNPTDADFSELEDKRGRTESERLSYRKGILCRMYPGIEIDVPTIKRDDDGWFAQIQLYYYYTVGRTYLEERDRAIIEEKQCDGKAWIPDLTRKLLSIPVKTLITLNVQQFLESDKEFTSASLYDWGEKMRRWKYEIKDALGVSISSAVTPIQIAQALLKKIGMKLPFLRQDREGNTRTRVYGTASHSDPREGVFQEWLKRDRKNTEKVGHPPGSPTEKESEGRHTLPEIDSISRGCSQPKVGTPPLEINNISRGCSQPKVGTPPLEINNISRRCSQPKVGTPPLEINNISRGCSQPKPPLGWIPNEHWIPPGDEFPAIGKEVWVKDSQGNISEGLIVRDPSHCPYPNSQGKWGLRIRISPKDEDLVGIYWYSPDRFTPRDSKQTQT